MSAAGATRVAVVALYALIGFLLCGDGTSAGDFVAMVVLGGIAMVWVLAADWIAAAPRRDE